MAVSPLNERWNRHRESKERGVAGQRQWIAQGFRSHDRGCQNLDQGTHLQGQPGLTQEVVQVKGVMSSYLIGGVGRTHSRDLPFRNCYSADVVRRT